MLWMSSFLLECCLVRTFLDENLQWCKFVVDGFSSNLLAPDSSLAGGATRFAREQPIHRQQNDSPGVSPRVWILWWSSIWVRMCALGRWQWWYTRRYRLRSGFITGNAWRRWWAKGIQGTWSERIRSENVSRLASLTRDQRHVQVYWEVSRCLLSVLGHWGNTSIQISTTRHHPWNKVQTVRSGVRASHRRHWCFPQSMPARRQ